MHENFPEINKNFGFGIMRLDKLPEEKWTPAARKKKTPEYDLEEFSRMIELYFEAGFNYFDTAHGYMEGQSEFAIRQCLTSKYPRDKYIITDKLTSDYFEKEEDIRPLFMEQLECCGINYFDFYLMHSQHRNNYQKFVDCNAYRIAQELKEEGRIRHIGISFHDTAELLEQILTEHPEIEVVQIQLNYIDYEEGSSVDSRRLVEVCCKYNKPIIIMEPVKGGMLAKLPEDAAEIFNELSDDSYASYAIRFAAGVDNVVMVLSGMSNVEQMKDNISFMQDLKPLNEEEYQAIDKVCEVFRNKDIIPCTGCSYCVEGCPQNIDIPWAFNCLNVKKSMNDDAQDYYYKLRIKSREVGKASDCIECGKCEQVCPQHLEIRSLLKTVAEEFEKQEEDK